MKVSAAAVESLFVWRRGWGHCKHKEGRICSQSGWWSGGGRGTGSAGVLQEVILTAEERADRLNVCVGNGERGLRRGSREDNILAAVMCQETAGGLQGCLWAGKLLSAQG